MLVFKAKFTQFFIFSQKIITKSELYINAQEECFYITYFNPLCGNKDRRKLLLLQQSAIVCDVIKSCQPSNPINFVESSISNQTKVRVYVLCLFHCLL